VPALLGPRLLVNKQWLLNRPPPASYKRLLYGNGSEFPRTQLLDLNGSRREHGVQSEKGGEQSYLGERLAYLRNSFTHRSTFFALGQWPLFPSRLWTQLHSSSTLAPMKIGWECRMLNGKAGHAATLVWGLNLRILHDISRKLCDLQIPVQFLHVGSHGISTTDGNA
jgi:hypothetical protein